MKNRQMPLISILLPFYNAHTTLPECLHSIQTQTHTHWELIAVDDQSTDGSAQYLELQARKDSRIRVFRNPRKGLVNALNFGLQYCRSDWVARMDADDIMHPERLAVQVRHIRHTPGLALSATQVRGFPEQAIQAGYREYLHWQNQCVSPQQISEQIYVESPLAHPSVCFKKSIVMRLGGYRNGPFPEDYDLWLRMHAANLRMEKIPRVLLDWRDDPNRVSRTDARCSRDAFDRLKFEYLIQDPRFLAKHGQLFIWGAGRRTRRRCDPLLERGFKPKAWIDIDPKKIGGCIQGIPVIAWQALPTPKDAFVLIAVSNHGARQEISDNLSRLGFKSGRDFLPIA